MNLKGMGYSPYILRLLDLVLEEWQLEQLEDYVLIYLEVQGLK